MTILTTATHRLSAEDRAMPGAAFGAVATTLRLEGLAALIGAVAAYYELGPNWLMFAVLFLVPDISMLGYLAGRRTGAVAYNIGHSYMSPALLALTGLLAGAPILYSVALIWVAHIGFDRMLGYGLKYGSAFGDTHLGRKGKGA